MGNAYLVRGIKVETAVNAAIFYLDFEAAMKTVAGILAEGLKEHTMASGKRGIDKCAFCGPDPARLSEHLDVRGISLKWAEEIGNLRITNGSKEAFKDGKFDPETAANNAYEFIRAAKEEGCPARIIADVTSLTTNEDHINEFLAKADELLNSDEPIIGVCMYDLAKISSSFFLSLLEYHPVAIFKNVVKVWAKPKL
jgi:hypothetical protein